MGIERIPAETVGWKPEEVVTGRFNTDGTVIAGSGFTLTSGAAGHCTINFASAFSTAPQVIAIPYFAAGATSQIIQQTTVPSTTSAAIAVSRRSDGVDVDAPVDFIAYVPASGTAVSRLPDLPFWDYGLVTVLPTTPTPQTGDLCTYVDSLSAPTYRWRLQYNGSSSSAYKWECVGGSALAAYSATTQTAASTSYTTPAGALSLTLPLAGDWEVWGAVRVVNTVGFTNWSYTVGALASSDDWSAWSATGNASQPTPPYRHLGRPAGNVVTEQAKVNTVGGTQQLGPRSLRAMPVRVG
jgi:hypothetical protein